jgi:hypothetical protein
MYNQKLVAFTGIVPVSIDSQLAKVATPSKGTISQTQMIVLHTTQDKDAQFFDFITASVAPMKAEAVFSA